MAVEMMFQFHGIKKLDLKIIRSKKEEKSMDSFDLFKLIFYALDDQYDQNPNEELGQFLSSMNPFLFTGEGSAVPDIYEDFKTMFEKKYTSITSIKESYEFAKEYIKSINIPSVTEAFEKVSFEAWNNAIKS